MFICNRFKVFSLHWVINKNGFNDEVPKIGILAPNIYFMKFLKTLFALLLAVASVSTTLYAQQFHIEKSDVFEEPGPGWAQLLQLRNGNTFLLHATEKNGIDVTVYDKNRKLVAQKNLGSELWDPHSMEDIRQYDLYEINGAPVLFLLQRDGKVNSMFRIQLDPSDGSVRKEEKVASLLGLFGEKYAVGFGLSGIHVVKDPESDCYALILVNTDNGSYSQQASVMHFDGAHTLLNKADFKIVGASFRHSLYKTAAVDGNKCVYLVSSGYYDKIRFLPSSLTFDEDCKVVLSKLKVTDKAFTSKVMKVNIPFRDVNAQLLYNKNTDRLQLRIRTLEESKFKRTAQTTTRYYLSLISYFDPETLDITYIAPLAARKVAEYAQSHIGSDYSYSGVPKKMTINIDKTTSVLMEESYSGQGRAGLGAIGVSILSDTGAEISGYAISKKQVTYNNIDNRRFMSYDYVSIPNGNYVIFNDAASNIEKDESDAGRRKVAAASLTNAVAYKLSENNIDRMYLFGAPKDNSSVFCYTDGTDFDKTTRVYATVMVERTGREKQARIAWVTFE